MVRLEILKKEAQILLQQKENEETWNRINNLFLSLKDVLTTKDFVGKHFSAFSELLIRSVQSDRSKLNGTCLFFLEHCCTIHPLYDFNQFIPILFKLSGKANKVFTTRAQKTLLVLCKKSDIRKLSKYLSEPVGSNNKKIREAAFMVIAMRCQERYEIFRKYIEKGKKDASLEVRTICKGIPEFGDSIQNSSSLNSTPRKHVKTNVLHDKTTVSEKLIQVAYKNMIPVSNINLQRDRKIELKKEKISEALPIKTPILDDYLNSSKAREDTELKKRFLEHKKNIQRSKDLPIKSRLREPMIVQDISSGNTTEPVDERTRKQRFCENNTISPLKPFFEKNDIVTPEICNEIANDNIINGKNCEDLEDHSKNIESKSHQKANIDTFQENFKDELIQENAAQFIQENVQEVPIQEDEKEHIFDESHNQNEIRDTIHNNFSESNICTTFANGMEQNISETVDLSRFIETPGHLVNGRSGTINEEPVGVQSETPNIPGVEKIICTLTYEEENFMFNSDMRSSKDHSINHELVDENLAWKEVVQSENIQGVSDNTCIISDIEMLNRSFANISIASSRSRIDDTNKPLNFDDIKNEVSKVGTSLTEEKSDFKDIIQNVMVEDIFGEDDVVSIKSHLSLENNVPKLADSEDKTIIFKENQDFLDLANKTTIIDTPFKKSRKEHKIFNDEIFSENNLEEKKSVVFKSVEKTQNDSNK